MKTIKGNMPDWFDRKLRKEKEKAMSTRTKDKSKFISPNELHQAAKDCYFGGDDPQSPEEWAMIVNFWAANVSLAEESICLIMAKIYNCPLPDNIIKEIAEFQAKSKKKGNGRRPNHN